MPNKSYTKRRVPKDNPSLWTPGIALDEAIGEMGIAYRYGAVLLGTVYRSARLSDPSERLRDVRETGPLELWGAISVDEHEVREFLHADAEQSLKPGQRYELRRKIPDNYGRSHGMAWYRNAAMDKRDEWGRVPIKPELAGGYYLVGEFTTPSEEER